MAETLRFRPEDLKAYAASFFCHFGVPEEDAEIVADVLITADLRGVHSHGIARLHAYYGDRLRRGLINPQTPLTLLHETPTTLAFDAGNGLGQVAGVKAMQACIAKAREVGVRHSHGSQQQPLWHCWLLCHARPRAQYDRGEPHEFAAPRGSNLWQNTRFGD